MFLIDALFASAIIVNLLKAGELILRPHQQKRVQQKMEHLTLFLSELRPLKWYRNAVRPNIIQILSLVVAICMMGFFWQPLIAGLLKQFGSKSIYVSILMASVAFLSARKATIEGTKKLRWAAGLNEESEQQCGMLTFAKRLGISTVVFMIVFIAQTVVLYALGTIFIHNTFRSNGQLLSLAAITSLGWAIELANILLSGVFVFGLAFVFSIGGLFVLFFRGLTWRIVEYHKGAFAALILLATALIGALEAYFRFLRKI